MAAEIEDKLQESSELIQSSGGVFEIEDNSQLIFSKQNLHRFPEDGEILAIVALMQSGMSVADAQVKAAQSAPKPPSFQEWFKKLIDNR